MPIPASLMKEHRELHSTMERATREPGALGEAARTLAEKLIPHFEKEEDFALPPLGLLNVHGYGPATEVDDIIAQVDRLGKEMATMLEEHADIARASSALAEVARKEGREDYVEFAEALVDHARMEEEIMYPAALLIGSYLRLRKAEKVRSL
jgi:iron-sulfur cluster repair protein YtfE (RIC family)